MEDIILKKTSMDMLEDLCEGEINSEETAETVVPDTQPDIARIIDADGAVLLTSKAAEPGRVSAAANISITVLYVSEENTGSVRKLSLTIPYTVSSEITGADETCIPMADIRVASIEARALNPRKVTVRVNIRSVLSCYRAGCAEFAYDVESESRGVHTLREKQAFTCVTGAREKTFVVSDELAVSGANPPVGEILKSRTELDVEDVKFVGSRIIFKGSARSSVLYASPDGVLGYVSGTNTFSQIMEFDNVGSAPSAVVRLMLTGVYTEPMGGSLDSFERRTIGLEIHAVAQAVNLESFEVEYMSDAYSNSGTLSSKTEDVKLSGVIRGVNLRETIRQQIMTPAPVSEIIGAYAVFGKETVSGGKISFGAAVHVIYRDENGEILRAGGSYSIESDAEVDDGQTLELRAVRCGEIYALPSAEGIEIRVPVDMDADVVEKREISIIASMGLEEGVDRVQKKASLYVVKADGSEALWSLAKRYGSTVELISAANGLEEQSCIGERMMIVPRER